MPRAKITLTIDEDLIVDLDRFAKNLKESRSRIIENALKAWCEWKMKQELVAGYQAMAQENSETAELCIEAGSEVLG